MEKPDYEALGAEAKSLKADPERLSAICTVYSVWGCAWGQKHFSRHSFVDIPFGMPI